MTARATADLRSNLILHGVFFTDLVACALIAFAKITEVTCSTRLCVLAVIYPGLEDADSRLFQLNARLNAGDRLVERPGGDGDARIVDRNYPDGAAEKELGTEISS
ncbi:MAG: hypothetical protein E5V19_02210, partial [Mesorhizobium sp.]